MSDPRQDLHQGFFVPGLPMGWTGWGALVLGVLLAGGAAVVFLAGTTMIDVPPVADVPTVDAMDDVDMSDPVLLYKTSGSEGVWVRTQATTPGVPFGYASCTTDSDGNSQWSFTVSSSRITLSDGTEVGFDSSNIPVNYPTNTGCSNYEVGGNEDIEVLLFVSVLNEGLEVSAHGFGVLGQEPARPMARMAAFSFSYAVFAGAALVLMGATSPPGARNFAKMQKEHNPRPRLHKDAEGLRYAVAPEWEGDQHDWLFDPPGHEVWNRANPYAADHPEALLPEHPNNLGSIHLATFTLYSVWGLGFVAAVTAAGLYTDRSFDRWLAVGVQLVLLLLSICVLSVSYGRWKRLHSMIDTPTSTVRSVAVGPAELVGEVRPAMSGSLRVTVGTSSVPGAQVALTALTDGVVDAMVKQVGGQHLPQHTVDGVVAFEWLQEVWETRETGSGDNRKSVTKWWYEASDGGSTEFILHDGTGGILVDPSTWMKRGTSSAAKGSRMGSLFGGGHATFGFGPAVFTWQHGQIMKFSLGRLTGLDKPRRWSMSCLRVGDPVYALGKVMPRAKAELDAEGMDGSTPSSNLRVIGEDDVGVKASMHRGTEFSLMCSVRSTAEAIAIPVLMVIGSILPLLS